MQKSQPTPLIRRFISEVSLPESFIRRYGYHGVNFIVVSRYSI
jgi:hypothetical protein